eukprot:gene32386-biopygen1067
MFLTLHYLQAKDATAEDQAEGVSLRPRPELRRNALGLAIYMTALPDLPPDIVTDLVLQTLRLEAPICDISAVCRLWHSIVVRHLAELLILRDKGNMLSVLRRALKHNKLDVALDLVSKTGSLDESNEALVLVAHSGQAHLVRFMLHAPQHAAQADCLDGQALVAASEHGHIEVMRILLDVPQHAAHADCQDGRALVLAANNGHKEVVRMLLDAPQHAARADCQDGFALLIAAQNGHIEVVSVLLDAPQHTAHADCQDGRVLEVAAHNGHSKVVRILLDAPQHAAHADCQDGKALLLAAKNGHIKVEVCTFSQQLLPLIF